MPTERLSMRHIREVLRLHYSVGMSQRAVARSLGLAQGTVSKYLNRARRAGLTWPLRPELDDDARLENRLYPPPSDRPSDERPQPDWALVHRELRRPNVTLMLLWEECCDASSDSFSYSWFCERYKEWAGRLKPTLRQVHVAGENLFVDYSGHTMEVVDGLTGEVRSTQIFVAVLGASNYTYAEASLSQSLPDWIASHVRAFAFFGGVARQTVSDNLKAGITRACFHEPMVNRTYADLARHYRTAIVPARPYRPRDKAKVEVGVQIVGRWILARLRNRRFFSLAALNEAIHSLLVELNDRPLRSWGRSRRDLFEELDHPALTPLPDEPYEYAEWKRCRVNLDYHVEIAKHYYSVPHSLVHQEVEARITQKTVEIFLRGKRVASHLRSTLPHRPTTIPEHMPSSHRRYRDWTLERIRSEAAKVGPDAQTLIDVILRSRPHPEQGFRSAIGILGLVKRYGQERVDAACARALLLNARSYKSVAAILKNGTDRTAPPAEEAPILFHTNIRGAQLLQLIRRDQHAHSPHRRSLARTRPRRHGRYLRRTAEQSRGGRDAARRLARPPRRSRGHRPRQPPPHAPLDRGQAPSSRHHRERRLSHRPWSRSFALPEPRHLSMDP
ncbi:transposase [Bradyrhizobium japonicum]